MCRGIQYGCKAFLKTLLKMNAVGHLLLTSSISILNLGLHQALGFPTLPPGLSLYCKRDWICILHFSVGEPDSILHMSELLF